MANITLQGYDQKSEVPVFTYDELDSHSNQIRLLRILPLPANSPNHGEDGLRDVQLKIFHANLDENPSYHALSYTWGSESDPSHVIYLNGCRFDVRQTLWHALNQFRAGNIVTIIWIDAICINQSVNSEKDLQVAKMKMIYQNASKVIVWLGTHDKDSDLAFRFVQELYDHRQSLQWLRREYWRRIWIVQELIVASDIVFYCSDSSVRLECLVTAQRLLHRIRSPDGSHHPQLFELLRHIPRQRNALLYEGTLPLLKWKMSLNSNKPSFYDSLLYHCNRKASDPRDMIYGLAALANETSQYKVEMDYSVAPEAVFTNFAKLEIESSKKLDVITRVLPGLRTMHLPSWVVDWSQNIDSHTFLYDIYKPDNKFYAAGHLDAMVAFNSSGMTFRGVALGFIELVSPRTNMKSKWNDEKRSLILPSVWKLFFGTSGSLPEEHEAFIRTLTLDSVTKINQGIRTKSEFIRAILGYWALEMSGTDQDQTGIQNLREYWNSYVAKESEDDDDEESFREKRKGLMQGWLRSIQDNLWDRRFFIGSSKVMGVANQEASEGDLICIPLGCCHPVILRRIDDHYINLGEAYVDGYMHGEVIHMLEMGELQVEEFELR